ncbi:hypothetical protein CHN50_16520 [Priestia aryabhattai]|uniref:hypothetical protein n=1 Tax=Bacillus sp. CBEL-1 TaxID=2502980 RepID=UPI000B9FF91B|nr:hypothetical protein [Bacillus sp. CBEL-1]OZT11388.1 hypothetical protein CHN50_16520 [Priestia aryabhattai]TDB48621.1 hypothetical protein EPL02_19760 [Bacillus sp. CBEL-1]
MAVKQYLDFQVIKSPTMHVLLDETNENGIHLVKVKVKNNHAATGAKLSLEWTNPCTDIHGCWLFNQSRIRFDDQSMRKLPHLNSFYNDRGENRYSVTCSDTSRHVALFMTFNQEKMEMNFSFQVEIPFNNEEYECEIRIDTRDIPYEQSLVELKEWHETKGNVFAHFLKKHVSSPTYVCTDSFPSEIQEIEENVYIARQLGFERIVAEVSYELVKGLLEDREQDTAIQKHIAYIHQMELDYTLSVYLTNEQFSTRRRHILAHMQQLLDKWKFDRIEIRVQASSDCDDTEHMVYRLLQHITSLQKGRQVLEVGCFVVNNQSPHYSFPSSFMMSDRATERLHIKNLRHLYPNQSIQSPIIQWHENESVENASLYFINTLFAVPHVSISLKHLSYEHSQLLSYWITFWKDHCNLLNVKKIRATSAQMNAAMSVEHEHESLVVRYDSTAIQLKKDNHLCTIVNGSEEETIIVKLTAGTWQVRIVNCLGKVVHNENQALSSGFHTFRCPKSGVIQLVRRDL